MSTFDQLITSATTAFVIPDTFSSSTTPERLAANVQSTHPNDVHADTRFKKRIRSECTEDDAEKKAMRKEIDELKCAVASLKANIDKKIKIDKSLEQYQHGKRLQIARETQRLEETQSKTKKQRDEVDRKRMKLHSELDQAQGLLDFADIERVVVKSMKQAVTKREVLVTKLEAKVEKRENAAEEREDRVSSCEAAVAAKDKKMRAQLNNDVALESQKIQEARSELEHLRRMLEVDTAANSNVKAAIATLQEELNRNPAHREKQAIAVEIAETLEQRLCKICMVERADLFELSCGHIWCCVSCHEKRVEQNKSLRCGMCNLGSGLVQKAFFCE
jgi:chromosome segregation ATPase